MTEAEPRFQKTFDVSRETLERLAQYEALLERWNPRINLISPSTIPEIWDRHFMDSAQLLDLSAKRGHWVDLGSGGGFPGMVVAILAREARELSVTLVEADQRKATFLRTVRREIGLSVNVVSERIEAINPLQADILSARALAPLSQLLSYADRHLATNGRALFPKGQTAIAEIEDALEQWRFDCQKHSSITDEKATILSIGGITRV